MSWGAHTPCVKSMLKYKYLWRTNTIHVKNKLKSTYNMWEEWAEQHTRYVWRACWRTNTCEEQAKSNYNMCEEYTEEDTHLKSKLKIKYTECEEQAQRCDQICLGNTLRSKLIQYVWTTHWRANTICLKNTLKSKCYVSEEHAEEQVQHVWRTLWRANVVCLRNTLTANTTFLKNSKYWTGNKKEVETVMQIGSWDSLLVRALDSWPKGCKFESRQKHQQNFLLHSQHCVLTIIWCPFHSPVTAVARKRPRPFCQKCRWQVTPKYANTFDPMKSEWADYAAVQA